MGGEVESKMKPTMDIQELLVTLPHRYPFLLVDRITEWEPARRAVGYKNVTINEPFFQGHFPGRPIMPGVLIIEAMAQVAATLAMRGNKGNQVFLLGVDDYRVRRPVVPGDRLDMEVEVLKVKGAFWRFKAVAKVDGAVAANGEFLASVMNGEGGAATNISGSKGAP
jgi:3-hydroxyacyl-[acyl-carrier-protein] dehydratase